MRLLGALIAIALTLTSCAEESGSEPEDTPDSEAPLSDEELLSHLLDLSGCGTPVEQQDYPGGGVDMYSCMYGRAIFYLTETSSEMDDFIESAPCQPDFIYVRGDRWYVATGERALADRVLTDDGAEEIPCG